MPRCAGDGDPLDAVIIGSAHMAAGGVYAVKPLAVFAMIDEGELDWKVIAVRADDLAAAAVSDVEDVERRAPAAARRSRPRGSLCGCSCRAVSAREDAELPWTQRRKPPAAWCCARAHAGQLGERRWTAERLWCLAPRAPA